MKREILKMLSGNKDKQQAKRCSASLNLIDAIQRLGVAYHFEDQIEKELHQIFTGYLNDDVGDNGDLSAVALQFRLLREHGFNVTSGKPLNCSLQHSIFSEVYILISTYT